MTKPKSDDNPFVWLRRNWGVLAFAMSVAFQIWNGSAWVYDRTSNERSLEARIVKLESSYVSQETFNLTMKSIDFRLTNLDTNVAKLSPR